ncbi:MAG: hypothetical protein NC043_02040, partial [Muribaculaceae bacterium]|nr:hypothetical protein [Muribaculaceae bacterium]
NISLGRCNQGILNERAVPSTDKNCEPKANLHFRLKFRTFVCYFGEALRASPGYEQCIETI